MDFHLHGFLKIKDKIKHQFFSLFALNAFGKTKERRLTGHVITNFQLFLAVVLLLSKAALAGHKIGQNE